MFPLGTIPEDAVLADYLTRHRAIARDAPPPGPDPSEWASVSAHVDTPGQASASSADAKRA